MPLHTLREGVQIIAGLAHLGRALSYSVEEERPIGKSGAAVDLAWHAAGENDVSLIMFEVESSASSSMANNAMKVLSRDADDFVKPLFFFHVLLAGSEENERIHDLRAMWGKHNYRVYRLNDDAELLRLLSDILSQHRRICKVVDLVSIGEAVQSHPWDRLDRPQIFRILEGLRFDANYLSDYANSALCESSFRNEHLRRLREIHEGEGQLDAERYGTYLGDAFPNMLDVAVLVSVGAILENEAVEHLEAWQDRSGYMRTVGPHFGLSRDYDQHVIGISPFSYGVADLLMLGNDEAYSWFVKDLYSILTEARERWNFGGTLAIPMALWLAHLAAVGMERSPAERNQMAAAFNFASIVIDEAGGVPELVVEQPPCYVDIWDPGAWEEQLGRSPIGLPGAESLNSTYRLGDCDHWSDPVGAAIALSCKEDWPRWSTKGLVIALRKP